MNSKLLSKGRIIVVILGLSCSVWGCCHYPKARVARSSGTKPQMPTVTVVAYGDTRTGPWGLGDNVKQALHGKVVDDILSHDGPIDAVVFTGDAVMTNFPLWKKDYWRCFLTQSNRFRKANIPFYPSLGNHEVLSPIVPLRMRAFENTQTGAHILAEQDVGNRIAEAYEAGESAAANPQPAAAAGMEPVNPSTKQGQRQLKQWERDIRKGNAVSANKKFRQAVSANNFGQFEGHLQRSFYTLGAEKDERCAADAKTFGDNYLKQAKYDYLQPLLQGRSYYSKIVENDGVRVKLIALDTNCLDSQAQQSFFGNEVKSFNGPIIVFGHHPPVDYNKPGATWDLVPGWGHQDDEYMKRYFTSPEGKQIVLWIFGHVHDYQRRGSAGMDQQAVAPVLLVAGGGGASPLDPAAADFQWQPSSWPQTVSKTAYNQVKLSVTATSIAVEVRGAEDKDAAHFKVIDSFSIPLATNTRQ